jgi:hypothetical protein
VKVMFLKSSSAPNETPTLETESRVTTSERSRVPASGSRRDRRDSVADTRGQGS